MNQEPSRRPPWNALSRKQKARRASWVILIGGLALAAVLYLAVPQPAEDQFKDAVQSRAYRHELEVFGGKANVLQDEFGRWLAGLWQGKQLGITVAWLSVFSFLAINLALSLNRFDEETK